MSTMGPAFVVDGPRPIPPRYRLLDVAQVIRETDANPHWLNGGAVWPYPKAEAWTFDPCAVGEDRIKAEAGVVPLPEFGAFTVYVTETCTNRSVGDFDYWRDRGLATLEASVSFAVEREFSQGLALPGNPYLADADADVLVSGAVPPREGLSWLANAIGLSQVEGVIHATPAIVEAWGELHLQQSVEDGVLMIRATGGSPIVRGTGYIGAVPADEGTSIVAPGHDWAFATGLVQVRETAPEFIPGERFQAVDREANTITYRAEQHFLVTWDTYLQAAVLIDWTA